MQTRVGEKEVTSVFIITTSNVVRAGLESLIAGEAGFTIAGSGADLSELEAQGVEGSSPDLVILDAESLREETLGALRAIFEEIYEGRAVPELVVIGTDGGEWLTEALRGGVVHAALPRAASNGEIMAALVAVSTGLIAIDAETFNAVLSPPGSTGDDLPEAQLYDEQLPTIRPVVDAVVDALTPREREVLEMLAEGLSNKEIAWRMKISEHTVKFHIASIFAKLGVSTRTEAVVQGIRQGLVMM